MRIGTWNVNGIRARFPDVVAWAGEWKPDVFCLQEIKATAAQIPEPLTGLPEYWSFWHGAPGGYSGVSLHVRRSAWPNPLAFKPPTFDVEARILEVDLGSLSFASVYVPNGNRNYPLKLEFLAELRRYAKAVRERGQTLILCGDLNVARTDMDVHPRLLKPNVIGQRPEERELLEGIFSEGLVDVGRALSPDDAGLFTWWPPWREEKQKNRGWRLDYVVLPEAVFPLVRSCAVLRDVGTSDHAPVVCDIDLPLPQTST